MKTDKKEDLLSLFTISLALIACSVLVYMLRTPAISGSVVIGEFTSATTITVIVLLILVGIATLISATLHTHKMHKETESHKKAITAEKAVFNPVLAEYIEKARKNGFDDEIILKRLKEDKWNEKEIKNHLSNN